jgi:hypothetical protein
MEQRQLLIRQWLARCFINAHETERLVSRHPLRLRHVALAVAAVSDRRAVRIVDTMKLVNSASHR